MESIALAKERGVYDRKRKLSDVQIVMAQQKIAEGSSKASVARELGCSRTTLHATLEERGKYAESPIHSPAQGNKRPSSRSSARVSP